MAENDSKSEKLGCFVEIGNSNIKAAVRSGSSWRVTETSPSGEISGFAARLQAAYADPAARPVVSSVRADILEIFLEEWRGPAPLVLKTNDIAAGKLNYRTPHTLGIDRYLACLGARVKSESAVVVIDCGSACTADYMGAGGVFEGGVIMPGIKSVLQIFNETAPELPLVEAAIPGSWPGRDTVSSLQWGLAGFFADGLAAALKRFEHSFGEFRIFITGGDAALAARLLPAEVHIEPYLVFEGMEVLANSLLR